MHEIFVDLRDILSVILIQKGEFTQKEEMIGQILAYWGDNGFPLSYIAQENDVFFSLTDNHNDLL